MSRKAGDLASLPRLPRDEWSSHPNYPDQVLLLGSHNNFRRFSKHLVGLAAQVGRSGEVSVLFEQWMGAMRGHEAYEERKLYPFLQQRWGVSFEHARAGHKLLHSLEHRVVSRFEEFDAQRVNEKLLQALSDYDRILNEHLDHEEELVIPLLLALSPEEFRAFTTH